MKTIRISVDIPEPPFGWGKVEYRKVSDPCDLIFCQGRWQEWNLSGESSDSYITAQKLKTEWAPGISLVNAILIVFGKGWLTKCYDGECVWHSHEPAPMPNKRWESSGDKAAINEIVPSDIPWQVCKWKIDW